MNFALLEKCRKYAKEHGMEGMAAIEKRLAKESCFIEVHFSPDIKNVESGKAVFSFDEQNNILDAAISISIGKEPKAVFFCKVIPGSHIESHIKFVKESLESLCTAFNPKPPKSIVFKDTRWGKVEVRHSGNYRSNIYRLDGVILYTNRIIEFFPREEAEQWMIETMTNIPERIKIIDENYFLDYPLFKMKIRKYDGEKLSHDCDEEGVWWVNVPESYDLSRENEKRMIFEYFPEVMLSAGRQYFPQRVDYFQSKMMTPKKIRNVYVEEIKRNAIGTNHLNAIEPGSTRDDGTRDLCFEAKLMAYPAKFVDTVIIHELCHNVVWEHSNRFYELEANWCLSLLRIGPHYYDDFFDHHRLILFAPDPWKEF